MADWPYSTAAWQRLRKAKLAAAPLCEACALRGQVRHAAAVDHIKAIAKGGEAFPALDGLMALCAPCHSEKTAGVDRTGGKGVRFKGAGLDGLPIDPAHPFFDPGAGGIPPSKTAATEARTAVQVTHSLSFSFGAPEPCEGAG